MFLRKFFQGRQPIARDVAANVGLLEIFGQK
jgi:hypothetical protein